MSSREVFTATTDVVDSQAVDHSELEAQARSWFGGNVEVLGTSVTWVSGTTPYRVTRFFVSRGQESDDKITRFFNRAWWAFLRPQ